MKPERNYYVLRLPLAQGETLAQLKELLELYKEREGTIFLCNCARNWNLDLALEFIQEYAHNPVEQYRMLLPEAIVMHCPTMPKYAVFNLSQIRKSLRVDWLTAICNQRKTLRIPKEWLWTTS